MLQLTEEQTKQVLVASESTKVADSLRRLINSFSTDQSPMFEIVQAVAQVTGLDLASLVNYQLSIVGMVSYQEYILLLDLLVAGIEEQLVTDVNLVFRRIFSKFLFADLHALTTEYGYTENLAIVYRYMCSQAILVEMLEDIFETENLPIGPVRKNQYLICYDCYAMYDQNKTSFNTIVDSVRRLRKHKVNVTRLLASDRNTSIFYIPEQHTRLYQQMQEYLELDNHRVK